jgi:hypothetical protein
LSYCDAPQQRPGDRAKAEVYRRDSIVTPDFFYIVDDFLAGLMLFDLEENLSQEQIENLISCRLTLK